MEPYFKNQHVKEIAEAIGRSQTHVSRMLSGERPGSKECRRDIMRFCRSRRFGIDFAALGWKRSGVTAVGGEGAAETR